MGRSVSTPRDVIAVCYRDISDFGYELDDDCNVVGDVFDDWLYQDDFENFLYDINYEAKQQWKSFTDCDKWVGREDHAILENDFAYIGVSVYCGLAAVWLMPKTEELLNTGYADDAAKANLADNWCNRIAKNFEKKFGQYVKVGTFSNGEAIYKKAA